MFHRVIEKITVAYFETQCIFVVLLKPRFLRAKAALFSARLSHRNSVRPFVRLSVIRVDQAKTVQARITKSSPPAARKTLVSGTVKLFHKFERGHPERGP